MDELERINGTPELMQCLIDKAVPGRRLNIFLRSCLEVGFIWDLTPQGSKYWARKYDGRTKWAKKDTKYLMEVLNLKGGEEEDLWL